MYTANNKYTSELIPKKGWERINFEYNHGKLEEFKIFSKSIKPG